MSGRGNPNPTGSKPDKLMRDALMLALKREATTAEGKPTRKLNLVAEAIVKAAIDGDTSAVKEIFDRVDGRVSQNLEVKHEGELTFRQAAISSLAELIGEAARARTDRSGESPLPN